MLILNFIQMHLLSSVTGVVTGMAMGLAYRQALRIWRNTKPVDFLIDKMAYGPTKAAGELVGYRMLKKIPDRAFSEEVKKDIENIGNILDKAWDEGVELGCQRARAEI